MMYTSLGLIIGGVLEASFSDLAFTTESAVRSGDTVIVAFTLTGVNTGSYNGVAANCAGIAVPGVAFLRVAEQDIAVDQFMMGPDLQQVPNTLIVTRTVVVEQWIDYNADGMGDVLWNDTEHNLMAVWLMEGGTQVLATGPVLPGPLGRGWEARAASDSNFDGMADVLWYAKGTNQAAVWLMDGTYVLAPGPVFLGPYDGG